VRKKARAYWWVTRVKLYRALDLAPPDPLGKLIYRFGRVRPGAFVVQIGAHDGSSLDPIQRYIRTREWRGILVEPQPALFSRLQQTYAGVEGLIFENVAIAPEEGTIELHYVAPTEDRGLPEWYDALASTSKDVLLSHKRLIPDIEERVRTMQVPSVPFGTLCERNGVEHIDFVQVDTEGFDFEILKLVDFARYRPALVQFEELHMDDETRREVRAYLASHGYEAIGNGMDCLCLNPAELGPREQRMLRAWRRRRAKTASA
jgi:FkbM family methyltransferase